MNTVFRHWIQGFEPPMAMRWQSLSDSFVVKRTQFHVSRVPDPIQGSEWMDPEHCALKLELGRKGPVYRLQARGNDVVLVHGIKEVGLVQGNTPREFLAAVVDLLNTQKRASASAEPSHQPVRVLRLLDEFEKLRGTGPLPRHFKLRYRNHDVYLQLGDRGREGLVYFDGNDRHSVRFEISLALVADEPGVLFRNRERPALPAVRVPQSRILPGARGLVAAIIKTAYDIAFPAATGSAEPRHVGDVVAVFGRLYKYLLENPLRSKYKGKTFVAQARESSFEEIGISVGEHTLTFKVIEDSSAPTERVVGLSNKLSRRGNHNEPAREYRIWRASSAADLLRRMAEVVYGL